MRRGIVVALALLLCASVAQAQIGYSGAASGGAGAILYKSPAAVATTGTVEQVLHTYPMPANTVGAIGDTVTLLGTCTHAANGNNRSWRLEWGGISGTVLTNIASTSSGIKTTATVSCTRTSTTTASCVPTTWTTAGNATAGALIQLTGVDFTAAVTLVLTATTATAAADLSCEAFVVSTF